MTNEQILKKAIEKAVKNGWKPTDDGGEVKAIRHTNGGAWFDDMTGTGSHYDWIQILFSHDFAKAFFGDLIVLISDEDWLPKWKYCLQQMAISDDRLKYLEQFIK